jgi:hypothetical protein
VDNKHCPSCLRQVPVTPYGTWGKHRVGPSKRAALCPMSGKPAPKKKPKRKNRPRRVATKDPDAPAIARNRLRVCPAHGVALVPQRTKHGTRWGCPEFGCTVAMWGGSTSTPADLETRAARMEAHSHFDRLWEDGEPGSRGRAYAALRSYMGLSASDCHIGMMTAAQCRQVVEFCNSLAALPGGLPGENYGESQTV